MCLHHLFHRPRKLAEAENARRIEQALHMLTQTEDGRPLWRLIRANACRDGRHLMESRHQKMQGRFFERDKLPVLPDKFRFHSHNCLLYILFIISSAIWRVVNLPPISAVRAPFVITSSVAFSITNASDSNFNE